MKLPAGPHAQLWPARILDESGHGLRGSGPCAYGYHHGGRSSH